MMKNILFALLVVSFTAGCAMDSEQEVTPQPPAAPQQPAHTENDDETPIPPAPKRPVILPGVGRPELTPSEAEVAGLIPDLSQHQFVLRNEKIKDLLEIRIV